MRWHIFVDLHILRIGLLDKERGKPRKRERRKGGKKERRKEGEKERKEGKRERGERCKKVKRERKEEEKERRKEWKGEKWKEKGERRKGSHSVCVPVCVATLVFCCMCVDVFGGRGRCGSVTWLLPSR